MEGKLHLYSRHRCLVLFEHSTPPHTSAPHILILIGGLGDGLINLPYTELLAETLPKSGFRLLTIQLSSSNAGWGIGSIARDVSEIAEAVTFAREHLMPPNPSGSSSKIVLMGSSTGCQDTLTYISSTSPLPPIDGVILQAPVSDRDAFHHMAFTAPGLSPETIAANRLAYDQCLALSLQDQARIATAPSPDQYPTTLLPLAQTNQLGFFSTPTSTTRFLSLWSPSSPSSPSPDDLFSSDLPPSTLASTFGSISRHLNASPLRSSSGGGEGGGGGGKPELLILHSGADEFHPPQISQQGLLEKWAEAVRSGGGEVAGESGVVEGARHNGAGEGEGEVRGKGEIVRRVGGYVEGLVGEGEREGGE